MNNVIFTITGPSGSGKSTLEKKLKEEHGFVPLISTTTRPKRAGEINGVHYHFVDDAHFDRLVENARLVEQIEYNGYRYGMTKGEVDKLQDAGSPGVFVCDPHGKEQIEAYAETVGIEVHRIFIDVEPIIQMGRLLDRYNVDCSAARDKYGRGVTGESLAAHRKARGEYLKRLVQAMTTERVWVAGAYIKADSDTPWKLANYDVIYSRFDEEVENEVISGIINVADIILSRDAEKKIA